MVGRVVQLVLGLGRLALAGDLAKRNQLKAGVRPLALDYEPSGLIAHG